MPRRPFHALAPRSVAATAVSIILLAAAPCLTHAAGQAHILIVAGQSNAVGYGADASLLPPILYNPQRDIPYQYNIGGLVPTTTFTYLRWLPTANGVSAYPKFFGPELSSGRVIARALPDTQFVMVKVAYNGTNLWYDWDPKRPGSLYSTLTQTVRDVEADIAAYGKSGVVDGMFWMQGESDAVSLDAATAYQANLTAFIAACRAAFAAPAMPFVIGRINGLIPLGSFPYREVVRAAEVAVADADPLTDWVDTDALQLWGDGLHFNAQGEAGLGQKMALSYLALRSALTPP